jgi:hypothetical protein
MDNLALVTVFFDYPEDRSPIFLENAKKYFNQESIFIARFKGLPQTTSYYEKFTAYKIEYLYEYIKINIHNKFPYLLFLDALDTNFYCNPANIVNDFLLFNSSIVFCGERELWPQNGYTHLYNNKEKKGDAHYLNSGAYIGYTDKILYHLENLIFKKYDERVTDQSLWHIQYLLNDDISVDQENKIFFSTHKAKKYVELKENIPFLKNINPYIVHDNGPFSDETIKITDLL